jgi:hypothetical protein
VRERGGGRGQAEGVAPEPRRKATCPLPPPTSAQPHNQTPRFTAKALRLGIGQSVGLMTFQEALALMGAAHSAADDAREAATAACVAD